MKRPEVSAERSAVEQGIARFMIFQEFERMRLYRISLQVSVTQASAIALDLLETAGVPLAHVAHRLPLPENWPAIGVGPFKLARSGASWTSFGHYLPKSVLGRQWFDRQLMQSIRRRGVVLRGPDHPSGELAFLVSGEEIEVVARLGAGMLHSQRGRVRLYLPYAVPEVLASAAPGRLLEDVISHPVLDGRGYRIRTLRNVDGGSLVLFNSPLVPVELPWAEELERHLDLCS